MNTGLTCIFDWLQFTIRNLDYEQVILQVLRLDPAEFVLLPKGRYGYRKQYLWGHVSVLCDGTDDMGVHVVMSGQGCREYEVKRGILELLEKIMLYDGKCTRVDLAVDDKTGSIIRFHEIKKAVKHGHIRSKWKTTMEIKKRSIKDGQVTGHTIGIGSRSSKIYMRIYDKALETGKPGPWYRIELEIKDERAQVLQDILLFENGIGSVISGILNNYITFIIPSKDTNKSRWREAPWWTGLVNEMRVVKLTRKPSDKTIEEVRDWVKKQIGPTLAMLMIYDEGDLSNLIKIVNSGKHRLKERHLRLIRQGRIKQQNNQKGEGSNDKKGAL